MRFFRRQPTRWVHPKDHRIVKFLPKNPPTRGDHVLVDGERCRVLDCPVTWNGLEWTMGERGIKVTPDPLPPELEAIPDQIDRLAEATTATDKERGRADA